MNGTIGCIVVSNSHGTLNNLLLRNARHKAHQLWVFAPVISSWIRNRRFSQALVLWMCSPLLFPLPKQRTQIYEWTAHTC